MGEICICGAPTIYQTLEMHCLFKIIVFSRGFWNVALCHYTYRLKTWSFERYKSLLEVIQLGGGRDKFQPEAGEFQRQCSSFCYKKRNENENIKMEELSCVAEPEIQRKTHVKGLLGCY